jgi:hypothetical protein
VTPGHSPWFVQRISHRRLPMAISVFGAVAIVLALR